MAIKVLIGREVTPGNEQRVQTLLLQLRARALEEPGYVSGETLFDSHNPRAMVVISTWSQLEDWQQWQESDTRKHLEAELRGLLAGPEKVQVLRERIREVRPSP
jgi:quinol monooxygenase YgiN